MILEACVGNLNSALLAEKLGADQIELCDRLDLDGTSPSIETVKLVCEQLTIPLKIIINPIPFDYNYDVTSTNLILKYIDLLNPLNLHGIVFGPLDKNKRPDLKVIKKIKENTDLPITFHKAIDQSNDLIESLQMLKEDNSVQFILSSGGKETARKGSSKLLEMKSILSDSPIELIAAGKITKHNLKALHEQLKINYYHGKKIVGQL